MIGRFYFQRTKNGNLVGEFSNNCSSNLNSKIIIQTESADALDSFDGFSGNYVSSWSETDKVIKAELIISLKENSNAQIYSLIWKDGKDIKFWGEGMLCGDILIGDYRDFEKEE